MNTSDLVGDANLARLRDAVEDEPRVVTLRGPGGVGKTTLARTAAGAERLFVELDVCRTAADIVGAVGEALGLPEPRRKPDVVGAALPDDLVVLDNAEHVVGDLATLLRDWLGQTDARFLVTSRERLALPDEVVVDVAPLDAEDARILFEMRARRVVPDFTLDEDDRREVDRLVRQVDGLPLAIELAAARSRILTPGQIRERLERRNALLREREPARGDRPERHWTLDACIEWSWELLDDQERGLLQTCAIFRGRFELEDVEAVAEIDGWEGDVLESLLEKSLLQVDRDDGVRFALYDAVRRFVEQRMPPDDALLRRYVEHLRAKNRAGRASYTDLVNILHAFELAIGPEPGLAVELLTEARPRLIRGGLRHHVRDHLQDALRRDHLTGVQRARLKHAESAIHYARMNYAACEKALDEAAELVGDADDRDARAVRAEIANMRGIRANESHDLERAAKFLAAALADLDALPVERQAHVLSAAGLGAMRKENLQDAVGLMDRALGAARQSPDRALLARTLSWSALVEMARGNLAEATRRLEQSIERFSGANNIVSEAQARYALASSWVTRDRDRALELAREAEKVARQCGLRVLETNAKVLVARLADDEESIDVMRQALAEFSPDSRHTDRWAIQAAIAVTFALRGEREQAVEELRMMLEDARRLGVEHQAERATYYLLVLHALEGEFDRVHQLDADEEFRDVVLAAVREGEVLRDDVERFTDSGRALMYDFLPMPIELLGRLLDDGDARPKVVVHSGGDLVEVPPKTVDLSNRYVLRRLFGALCDARLEQPGEPLTLEDLLEAGWPDEEMTYQSGIRRVYSAIRNLRKLGLEDQILTAEGGYMLDPDLDLVRK